MRTRKGVGIEYIKPEAGEVWLSDGEIVTKETAHRKTNPLNWTVNYHAKNGTTYTLHDVLFYEIQDALMELSRIAYENDTECDHITIV